MLFDDLLPTHVFAAAHRLRGVAERTPLRHSAALSRRIGRDAWLKLETEQTTGSFKARGAYNALSLLSNAIRERGVVAASAGNHGLGMAWAGSKLGIPVTVYVPSTAPAVKRDGIAKLGARVDASGADYDEAHGLAIAAAERDGLTYVGPCDGEDLIAGQGTVALEILEDLPDLRAVVLPVGGAGLLAGMGSLLRAVAPGCRIEGAQSVETDGMARSLAAGKVVPITITPTLADGLSGGIDEFALDVGRHALDAMHTVHEAQIERAIRWLHDEEGITAEGSAVVGVAAALDGMLDSTPGPITFVITGRNIDAERHARIVSANLT